MSNRYEISSLVQKRLKAENLTADDVLRKALNIKAEGFTTSDGTFFPEGTTLVALYKGKAVSAIVKNGGIDIDGKAFNSLSAAAAHFTGRPTTNGWGFWYAKFPGKPELITVSANKGNKETSAA